LYYIIALFNKTYYKDSNEIILETRS